MPPVLRIAFAWSAKLTKPAATTSKPSNKYYETLSPGFGGKRFEASFTLAVQQIEDGLVTHRRCFSAFHRVLLERFPYTVYYGLQAGNAVVVALLYSRYAPEKIRAIITSRSGLTA